MTTKNKMFDKNQVIDYNFKELIGESFLFSASTDVWRAKRKACSHAFYKDRLDNMMDCLKNIISEQVNLWNMKIGMSKSDRVFIDMANKMEKIFASNLIFITFGEDMADEMVQIEVLKNTNTLQFEKKMMKLRHAIQEVANQVQIRADILFKNPINIISYEMLGFTFKIGQAHRKFYKNIIALRTFVNNYVQDRKAGKRKSQVKGEKDLITLFFENRDIFTDEFIVDEILDFFAAGSLTTMNGSQTMLAHFCKDKESLKKVRDEFDTLSKQKIEEDPSLKDLDPMNFLSKILTVNVCQD